MLQPEMWLVPAVTSLNAYGFEVLYKKYLDGGLMFSKPVHCSLLGILLKLSHVTFIVYLLTVFQLQIQHYFDKKESMTLTLNFRKVNIKATLSLHLKLMSL